MSDNDIRDEQARQSANDEAAEIARKNIEADRYSDVEVEQQFDYTQRNAGSDYSDPTKQKEVAAQDAERLEKERSYQTPQKEIPQPDDEAAKEAAKKAEEEAKEAADEARREQENNALQHRLWEERQKQAEEQAKQAQEQAQREAEKQQRQAMEQEAQNQAQQEAASQSHDYSYRRTEQAVQEKANEAKKAHFEERAEDTKFDNGEDLKTRTDSTTPSWRRDPNAGKTSVNGKGKNLSDASDGMERERTMPSRESQYQALHQDEPAGPGTSPSGGETRYQTPGAESKYHTPDVEDQYQTSNSDIKYQTPREDRFSRFTDQPQATAPQQEYSQAQQPEYQRTAQSFQQAQEQAKQQEQETEQILNKIHGGDSQFAHARTVADEGMQSHTVHFEERAQDTKFQSDFGRAGTVDFGSKIRSNDYEPERGERFSTGGQQEHFAAGEQARKNAETAQEQVQQAASADVTKGRQTSSFLKSQGKEKEREATWQQVQDDTEQAQAASYTQTEHDAQEQSYQQEAQNIQQEYHTQAETYEQNEIRQTEQTHYETQAQQTEQAHYEAQTQQTEQVHDEAQTQQAEQAHYEAQTQQFEENASQQMYHTPEATNHYETPGESYAGNNGPSGSGYESSGYSTPNAEDGYSRFSETPQQGTPTADPYAKQFEYQGVNGHSAQAQAGPIDSEAKWATQASQGEKARFVQDGNTITDKVRTADSDVLNKAHVADQANDIGNKIHASNNSTIDGRPVGHSMENGKVVQTGKGSEAGKGPVSDKVSVNEQSAEHQEFTVRKTNGPSEKDLQKQRYMQNRQKAKSAAEEKAKEQAALPKDSKINVGGTKDTKFQVVNSEPHLTSETGNRISSLSEQNIAERRVELYRQSQQQKLFASAEAERRGPGRDLTAIANAAMIDKESAGLALEDAAAGKLSDFLYGNASAGSRDRLIRLTRYSDFHAGNARSGSLINDFNNNKKAIEKALKEQYGIDVSGMTTNQLNAALNNGRINGKIIVKGSDLEFLLQNAQGYKANEHLLLRKKRKEAVQAVKKEETLPPAEKKFTKKQENLGKGKFQLTSKKSKKINENISSKVRSGASRLSSKVWVNGKQAAQGFLNNALDSDSPTQEEANAKKFAVRTAGKAFEIQRKKMLDAVKNGKAMGKDVKAAREAVKEAVKQGKKEGQKKYFLQQLRKKRQERKLQERMLKQQQKMLLKYAAKKKLIAIVVILAVLLSVSTAMFATPIAILQPQGVFDPYDSGYANSPVNRVYTTLEDKLTAYIKNAQSASTSDAQTLSYGLPQSWINKIAALDPTYLKSEFDHDDNGNTIPIPTPAITDENGNIKGIDFQKWWGSEDDLEIPFTTYNSATQQSDIKNKLVLKNFYNGMTGDLGEIDCSGSPNSKDTDGTNIYNHALDPNGTLWTNFRGATNKNVTVAIEYHGSQYDYKVTDIKKSNYYLRNNRSTETYTTESIMKAALCMFYGMEQMNTPFSDSGTTIEGFMEEYMDVIINHILDSATITISDDGGSVYQGELKGKIKKADGSDQDFNIQIHAPKRKILIDISNCGLSDAMQLMDNEAANGAYGEEWLKANDPCGEMSKPNAKWNGWFDTTQKDGLSANATVALELYENVEDLFNVMFNGIPAGGNAATPLSTAQINDFLNQLSESGQIDDGKAGKGGGTRRDLLGTAMSLVGYFTYGYGSAIYDKNVISGNISTLQAATGGQLDCSAFVSLALGRGKTDASYSRRDTTHLYGDAHYQQIPSSERKAGDIVIKNGLGANRDHVVIYAGRFDSHDGTGCRDQYVECTTYGGVSGVQLACASRAQYLNGNTSSNYRLVADPFTETATSKSVVSLPSGGGMAVANSSKLITRDYFRKMGRVTWGGYVHTFYGYSSEMSGVVQIMRSLGYSEEEYPHTVSPDGYHMLGKYVMVAADLSLHPKGSIVSTAVGPGIVCDTGSAIVGKRYDIAVTTKDGFWYP